MKILWVISMYVAMSGASPLLAIMYATIIHDVASVVTLNMAKYAVLHVGDTLQMDSRPPSPVFIRRSLPFARALRAPPRSPRRLAMICPP